MGRADNFRRLTRGLRFRLTATYALVFAVLMVAFTGIFGERLADTLDTQVHDVLDQKWAAMKGYLRIERNKDTRTNEAYWYYDPADQDESRIVLGIRLVYLITDRDGNLIVDYASNQPAVSQAYQDLGIDPPEVIRARVRQALDDMAKASPAAPGPRFWTKRRNRNGVEYLIRSGIVFDDEPARPAIQPGGRRHPAALPPRRGNESHRPYYVSLGTSLAANHQTLREFSWLYVAVIPGALILGSLLGWFLSGRALTPVLSVAQAAQRISGSNLKLRIPTRDADDELDYLIVTFNRMIGRLEASFQQMKQFTTDASHELRTPITGIRGQLEVALFTAQTTDQYREAIFNALQDIDRLSHLVRALLLLSQAESGQLALQKSRLDLCAVVRDVVEQFQIPAEAAGLRLTADLAAECQVDADRVQIERMLTNLLSNAIKFTPEGGEVKVVLRAAGATPPEHRPRYLELIVQDTGQGIAAEHLPHIFERFYRAPQPGAETAPEHGLGLGLSFVAWIVKAHHGKLDVESAPGMGARFIVRLPAPGAATGTVDLVRQPAGQS